MFFFFFFMACVRLSLLLQLEVGETIKKNAQSIEKAGLMLSTIKYFFS